MALRIGPTLAAIVILAITGCSRLPFGALGASPRQAAQQGAAALSQSSKYVISGMVAWPTPASSNLRTQALASNIVSQATIALIDYNTGETYATTLSDNTGAFNLDIPGFTPASGETFILEAVKGADSQSPGSSTLRLRSAVEWNGSGWLSCTNSTVGGTIAINALTTALALEVGLGNAAVSDVIGAADNASPPDLLKSPINATVSAAEVLDLESAVNDYLLNNLDPVTQTSQVLPSISSASPSAGVVGEVVQIIGAGFVAVPGATTVQFNGVAAPIVAVTPTTIFATVPAQALSGTITVTTPVGTTTGPSFTIPNSSTVVINTFAPNPTSVGTILSVGGQGFVTPVSGNTVTFACNNSITIGATTYTCSGNLVSVQPQSGDAHSLGVVIPQNAISGPVQVSNAYGKSSNVWLSISITGTPVINDAFPNEGVDNQDMYLEGMLFGRTEGNVTFTDSTGKTYGAVVRQWRDNQVRVTVPWQVATGSATIMVTNSSNLSATTTWTVLNGTLNWGAATLVYNLPNQSGTDLLPAFSGHYLYLIGGGSPNGPVAPSNYISQMTLAADGGPGTVTPNIDTMPVTIGGPDAHGNDDTWQGDRFWAFDNDGTSAKAYLQFDQNGKYVSNHIIGPAFAILDGQSFFQHDTGITCGPKGCYMAGADESTSAAALNEIYELFNPEVGSIGPWQSIPFGGGTSFQDDSQIVLGNNLWMFGGCCGSNWGPVQASSPLMPDGTPTGLVKWGADPSGGNNDAWVEVVGNEMYYVPWNTSTVYEDPLMSGSYPKDYTGTWPTSTSLSPGGALPNQCSGERVVIGGYLYITGSCCGCSANGGGIWEVPMSS